MRFEINKDVFLFHLIIAQKALSTKTPNPALTGIKIEAKDSAVALTTSNGDISIHVKIEEGSLAIESPGAVLVPGKYLVEIVRKLESPTVTLSVVDASLLRIEADRSDITLNLYDLEDYPSLSFKENEDFVGVNVRTFKTMIRQTAFSASTIENRPILTGISLKLEGNELKAVSTDSYRLSQKTIELEQNYTAMNVIIPSKSLEELMRVVENNQAQIELHFHQNSVLFKYQNILFHSRLLEGNYPETSKLIPKEFNTTIVFNKEQLLTAIDRASLLSYRDGQNAIVKLNVREDDVVEISSNSPEIGRVLEEVYPVSEVSGPALKIAFSSKYLIEALKSFNSSEISVSFTGEIRPFVLTGEYDPKMLQLILPVKTD